MEKAMLNVLSESCIVLVCWTCSEYPSSLLSALERSLRILCMRILSRSEANARKRQKSKR